MADFCKQCSLEMFENDLKELAGLRTQEMKDKDEYPLVLCEGCGPILVDEEGACVSDDCLMGGHKT
jgi:hypothetical protein